MSQSCAFCYRVVEKACMNINETGHCPYRKRTMLMYANKQVPCGCGSGKARRELRDARQIFCAFVCDACERQKRSQFRDEIFTNPNYYAPDLGEEG